MAESFEERLEKMTKSELIDEVKQATIDLDEYEKFTQSLQDDNSELKGKLSSTEDELRQSKNSNERLQKSLEAANDGMLLDDGDIK